jgi:hypothetical protein
MQKSGESSQEPAGSAVCDSSASALNASLAPQCSTSYEELSERMNQFEREIYELYTAGCTRTDLLLNVSQFNLIRALFANLSHMGHGLEFLTDESGRFSDDMISPFCKGFDVSPSTPPQLWPTALQRSVKHHPWIDLYPFPQMRDNILRNGESWDDTELCTDLIQCSGEEGERSGMIVWGEPHDPANWEVSKNFVQKWGWVVAGCWDLFQSTNSWREKRGEPRLFTL